MHFEFPQKQLNKYKLMHEISIKFQLGLIINKKGKLELFIKKIILIKTGVCVISHNCLF